MYQVNAHDDETGATRVAGYRSRRSDAIRLAESLPSAVVLDLSRPGRAGGSFALVYSTAAYR